MEAKIEGKLLLNEFLNSIIQMPVDLVNAALDAAQDDDEKNIINAFAPVVTSQFKEISTQLRELSLKASTQRKSEAENFLKLSSANTLVSGMKLALPSIGSLIGKLGIDGIIKEIKKIIEELSKIFNWNIGEKIWKLINLIDEIIAIILSGGLLKFKNALSQTEQNYLSELTQLAKLQKASTGLYNNDEDEEA
jgi:hypothetical protein